MRRITLLVEDHFPPGWCPIHGMIGMDNGDGTFTCFGMGTNHRFIDQPIGDIQ